MEEDDLPPTRTPVEMHTPITEAGKVVSGLADIWVMWKLEGRLSFIDNIFKVMWDDESTSGDAQCDELKKTEDLTDWHGEPFVPGFKAAIMQIATAQVACAFAIQAMKAERNSKSAWAYACEANHWLGILQGTISGRGMENGLSEINKLDADVIKKYASEIGRIGAAKRYMPMRALEKWAIAQYRLGKWPSANKAAHDLKKSVMEHGRSINATLTEENAQRTIADWIRRNS